MRHGNETPYHIPPLSLSGQVMESGRVSISPDGLLIVASVQLSDAGLYSCNGSNSLGTLESDTGILLMVYCEWYYPHSLPPLIPPPPPDPPMNIVVHGSPPDLVVDVGGRVVVTCEASSVPQSHYVWWRQEEEEEGGRTEVQDTSHIMVSLTPSHRPHPLLSLIHSRCLMGMGPCSSPWYSVRMQGGITALLAMDMAIYHPISLKSESLVRSNKSLCGGT